MNPFCTPRMRIVSYIAVIAIAITVTLAACKTFDAAGANETIATLDQRIAVMDQAASDPEKTPEQREIARLKAEKFRADKEEAIALIAEDAAADQADPTEVAVTGIGNAVAAAVPGFGAAIALGIPIFFRVKRSIDEHKRAEKLQRIRADNNMQALTQTVVSVENAKALVPEFATAWQNAKLAIEAKQDESTKEVVAAIKTASQS